MCVGVQIFSSFYKLILPVNDYCFLSMERVSKNYVDWFRRSRYYLYY